MINHVFRAELKGNTEAIKNCRSFVAYIDILKNIGIDIPNRNFIEHGFQALVEGIIQYRRMLDNYEVISTCEEAIGVNGIGENFLGQKCSVSAVYTLEPEKPLTMTNNHLSTFFANSQSHHNIDSKQSHSMFLFSNAVGLHERTHEQFIKGLGLENAVALIMGKDISRLVDNDASFWEYFSKELTEIENPKERKELREHQIEAVKACLDNNKGMIIFPTGTGKSLDQADIIAKQIEAWKNSNCMGEIPVFVIATPRIVLTYQLIGTISEYLMTRGIDVQYVNLNSGKFDQDEIKKEMAYNDMIRRDIPSTISPKDLDNYYKLARKNNIPLVIGSTYHSLPKLENVEFPIYTVIYDEAHNLVSCVGRFSNEAKEFARSLKSTNRYSFTATMAFTPGDNEGTGLNNEDLYGKILCTKSPKQMIEKGEIVPPYIHLVKINKFMIQQNKKAELSEGDLEDVEGNIEIASGIVVEAYRQHRSKVKQYSCNPDAIGAKMLVVCKGEPSLSGFKKSEIIGEFVVTNPNVKLFYISSASGAIVDGEYFQGGKYKEKFMRGLRDMEDSDDAIIFHIDMIGEGIDVPGITGVMAFRDLGVIKSSQTLGRAMRLNKVDRSRLYSNKIRPLEWSKMIKPYAWVVLPQYNWDQGDMKARIVDIATKMREDLGYIPFENASGSMSDGRLEQLQKDDKGTFGVMPEEMDLIHEIEEPRFLTSAGILLGQLNNPIVRKYLIQMKKGVAMPAGVDIFAEEQASVRCEA